MGYGIPREAHRISLKEYDGTDNWVDIKPRRTGGDIEHIMSYARAPLSAIRDQLDVQLRVYAAFLERVVQDWNLKAEDSDTEPMPRTRETLMDVLPFELLQFLGDHAQAYYDAQLPTVEQLGNSNGRLKAPSK